jgi:hypothetical protein
MRLLRRVLLGLIAGAAAAFLAELVRPRRPGGGPRHQSAHPVSHTLTRRR